MTIPQGQRILAARKAKGWTQEELAEQTNLTVRTIQRLENLQNAPRLHTLRTIADALNIPLETLSPSPSQSEIDPLPTEPANPKIDEQRFLRLLNLTSLSYLLIPFGHFMVPLYLLKKKLWHHDPYRQVGWQIVRTQIAWNLGTSAVMLLTLLYNLAQVHFSHNHLFINYLFPFAAMYLLNGWLIYRQEKKAIGAGKDGFSLK